MIGMGDSEKLPDSGPDGLFEGRSILRQPRHAIPRFRIGKYS
jgi:hypothetical protein